MGRIGLADFPFFGHFCKINGIGNGDDKVLMHLGSVKGQLKIRCNFRQEIADEFQP